MIKGLEELNKIKNCLEIADEVDGDIIFTTGEYEEEESLNIVEKGLKALNIISEKLDLEVSYNSIYGTYMLVIPDTGDGTYLGIRISKEEYDILKEVLNNDD